MSTEGSDPPADLEPPPSGLGSGEFLRFCLEKGMRPPPEPQKAWKIPNEFARAIGGNSDSDRRKVDGWLKNEYVPDRHLRIIAKALFGTDSEDHPWVKALTAAAEKTRAEKRKSRTKPPDPGIAQSNVSATKPLANFWSRVGNSFVPLAIAWGVYCRNGWTEVPTVGQRVSRAYLGIGATLAAAAILTFAFALYARSAAAARASLVPPNTMFEEADDRNPLISWATIAIYSASVLAALVEFTNSYTKSRIYEWDAVDPLKPGFWSSRIYAHEIVCTKSSCFAMQQRCLEIGPHPDECKRFVEGVFQYLPYLTDGALGMLLLAFIAALIYLVFVLRASVRAPSSQ